MSAELPPDWQHVTAAMIRGARPLDGGLFVAGAVLGPDAQIAVYREQFDLRFWDVVAEDACGLLALLGDVGEPTLRAYLRDCPPDAWTLSRVCDRLEGWLVSRGAPVEQVEMAWLDRAVQRSFVAAGGLTPTPEALAAGGFGLRLRLQPHVRLRRLTHDVHHVRMDLSEQAEVRAPSAGDFPVAIFRAPTLKVRHFDLEPSAYTLLEALGPGATLEAAVMAAAAVDPDPAALVGKLGVWFRRFTERGLFEVCP